MGITCKQLVNSIINCHDDIAAIRSCFIIIIVLLVINIAFTCTLSICMYHKLQPKTQTYTPVPYEILEDMELPD